MKVVIVCIFCFIFFSSCEKNENKNTSMAYRLKEFQDLKERNAFHRFPIVDEVIFTVDHTITFNQLIENKNNFDEFGKQCFEPEFGFKIIQPNRNIKSVLVSLECSRLYIYQDSRKTDYILSPLGKENFQLFFYKIFANIN